MDDNWDRDNTSIAFQLTTFRKQNLAYNHANKLNVHRYFRNESPTHVFSRECSASGHRYFLVENVSSFYHKYKQMNKGDLAFYEIFRPDFPCRLYFDIEFDQTLNPNEDGETAMIIFRKFLIQQVRSKFGVDISQFRAHENNAFSDHMVELDASNSKKFSRHIIITFPGNLVFQDNAHAGRFVKLLCTEITNSTLMHDSNNSNSMLVSDDALPLRSLFFLKKDKDDIIKRVLFVDQGVYAPNQNYRLPLSAKFIDIGTRHFKYYIPESRQTLERSFFSEELFNASLATYPAVQGPEELKFIT